MKIVFLPNIFSTLLRFADHHGPPKVNCWQDPMNPSKWKEEHVSLFLFHAYISVLPFISYPSSNFHVFFTLQIFEKCFLIIDFIHLI